MKYARPRTIIRQSRTRNNNVMIATVSLRPGGVFAVILRSGESLCRGVVLLDDDDAVRDGELVGKTKDESEEERSRVDWILEEDAETEDEARIVELTTDALPECVLLPPRVRVGSISEI
jgi:hypothetical protein